ncbi:hypothetical protein BLOT_006578 [Blomia tropicalis]|nr:hypothetical protein BLOT_006578 [Blomia tropicalis]
MAKYSHVREGLTIVTPTISNWTELNHFSMSIECRIAMVWAGRSNWSTKTICLESKSTKS